MPHTTLRTLSAAALASLLVACSDGAGPGTSPQVTFRLSTAPASSAPLAFLSDTLVGADADVIVLDTVQLVLRDVRFERVNDDACESGDGDGDQGNDDSDSLVVGTAGLHDDGNDDDSDDDACEHFNAGPYLLDLPLDSSLTKAFSVAVDTGSYDGVRIKIHAPESNGDSRDAAFLAQHPEFQGVSIRTVGSFNGVPFVFITDLDAQQRMAFAPPLVVADSVTNVDVTIRVDVSGWFADGAGGLLDPATANTGGANEQVVEDNIRNSFHAFHDDDRDGENDDHDDGDVNDHHGGGDD